MSTMNQWEFHLDIIYYPTIFYHIWSITIICCPINFPIAWNSSMSSSLPIDIPHISALASPKSVSFACRRRRRRPQAGSGSPGGPKMMGKWRPDVLLNVNPGWMLTPGLMKIGGGYHFHIFSLGNPGAFGGYPQFCSTRCWLIRGCH